MPNIKTALHAEIQRVARKEMRGLKDTIASQQKTIKELAERLKAVEKELANATAAKETAPIQKSVPNAKGKSKKRFPVSMMNDFRRKYFLSQQNFAKLLGVAHATVERWVEGKGNPAQNSIDAFYKLINLNEKQVFALIAEKIPEALVDIETLTPKKFDAQAFLKSVLSFRKRNSISQDTLAKLIDIQKETVTKWETGKYLPSFSYAQRFYALEKLRQDELFALMAEKTPRAYETIKKIKEKETSGASYLKTMLALRKRYSISQKTLGKLLGTSKRTVTVWESGTPPSKEETVKAIESLANLTESEMMSLIAEKAPEAYALLKRKEAKLTRIKKTATRKTVPKKSAHQIVPAEPDVNKKPQSLPPPNNPSPKPKTETRPIKMPGQIVLTVGGLK